MTTNMGFSHHRIPLEEASRLVARFRHHLPAMLHPAFGAALPLSETFNKGVFETLCSQPGAIAIRAYFGLDDNNLVRLIFVAVDENEQDMVPGSTHASAEIFEFGQRCPPICPPGHPLNPLP